MSRWWRAYDEAVDDPKLCLLSDKAHRAWFNLMCITSANDGTLPHIETIAMKLRMSEKKLGPIIEELVTRGLLDEFDGALRPHNWNGRQFKSDVTDATAAERMRNYRNRHRNAAVTVTVPREEQIEQKQIQKERKKDVFRAVAKAPRPTNSGFFDEFWKVYPKRKGANPKEPARKLFAAAVASGAEPQEIIGAAGRCAAVDREKIGTEFIPQAVRWLRDRRWGDYPATTPTDTEPVWKQPPPGGETLEEIRAKFGAKNGHAGTPEVRGDAGVGEAGSDHAGELQLPSGKTLRGS